MHGLRYRSASAKVPSPRGRPMMDRPMGIPWLGTNSRGSRSGSTGQLLIIAQYGSLSFGKRRQRRRDPIISFHCWFGSNLGEAEKQKRGRLSTAHVFICPPSSVDSRPCTLTAHVMSDRIAQVNYLPWIIIIIGTYTDRGPWKHQPVYSRCDRKSMCI